jgi:predicted amidohydrolase YtcJ
VSLAKLHLVRSCKYILLAKLAASCLGAVAQSPDLIFVHGNILTGAHLIAGQPDSSSTPARVSAMALKHGMILAVGTDVQIEKLHSPETRSVDLRGSFVMPGFNDAHVHLWSAGAQKVLSVDLDHTRSLEEMQGRIRTFVSRSHLPAGSWIQGAGWDHTLWPSKSLPRRSDLDTATSGHPAIFFRTDGHILVANSAALAAAHVDASTPDPPGAKIDHDGSGLPTGILREAAAMKLVEQVISPPSMNERYRALEAAITDALAHGVTSVQDYSPDVENFMTLETMERNHRLKLRVSEWLDFNLPLAVLQERRASHSENDPVLRYSMLKGFMDGSLGSRTAALAIPYSDEPENSGIVRYDQEALRKMTAERTAAGFQIGFHAIGDRANHMALTAVSAAEDAERAKCISAAPRKQDGESSVSSACAPASFRFRIEHAQVLLAGDFARFSELGVIASMQPSHLLTDMNWAGARLGSERSRYAYAWRSFLEHQVTLAFGTDYPVESIDPFRGLYAATTRQNEAGTQTFEPQEKISLEQAIYAYTQGSAFASFREHQVGRLEPGFQADFVVLDRDLTTATSQQLLHTRVLQTIVDGETVYLNTGTSTP